MNFSEIIKTIKAVNRFSLEYEEIIYKLFGMRVAAPYQHTISTFIPKVPRALQSALTPISIEPQFSVVIPTRNRPNGLMRTLESILNQSGVEKSLFEIIVVNDCSNDDTENAVRVFLGNYGDKVVFKYARLSKNVGPAPARNYGILNARGSYVAFTDDDCVVPPDWLFKFKEAFKSHPEVIGVGGWKELGGPDEIHKADLYERFLFWKKYPYMLRERKSDYFDTLNQCGDTANVCYRRDALLELGGFNPFMKRFGHWELRLRINKKRLPLLYHLNHVRHFSKKNFEDFIHNWFQSGWGFFLTSIIHPDINHYRFDAKMAVTTIRRDVNRLVGTLSDSPLLKRGDKLRFLFLILISNFLLFAGKYLILFSKRQKKLT